MKIIWCMIPEIWSATDRIVYHFGTIFCPFNTHPPLPPTTTQRIKILKKWKKSPGDVILHKCTINGNHEIYGSWDMKCNWHNFLVILGHFLPFYHPTFPKNENIKKMKKTLNISSFYTSVPKIMIIGYAVPGIRRVTDVIVIFYFGLFFALLPPPPPPLTARKIKISKNWRRYLEVLSSYASVQKLMIRWCTVPEIWCAADAWADGRTDGRKKWHI